MRSYETCTYLRNKKITFDMTNDMEVVILGAFAKLRKGLLSSSHPAVLLPVHLSACIRAASLGRISVKFGVTKLYGNV